jgi:hypothetical protein
MSVLWLVPVFFVLALIVPTAWSLGGAYRRASGTRLVRCPETNDLVEIGLDTAHAVKMHIIGYPQRKVGHCARWPERRDCGQGCVGLAA